MQSTLAQGSIPLQPNQRVVGYSKYTRQFADDSLPVSDGGPDSLYKFFPLAEGEDIRKLRDRLQSAVSVWRRTTGASNQMPVRIILDEDGVTPIGVGVWKLATAVARRTRKPRD